MFKQASPLFGLVLAGGHSTRMKHDKGMLEYHGMPRREYCCTLLAPFCENVFISCRKEQVSPSQNKFIIDSYVDIGPISGIASAMIAHPDASWIVLACDLFNVTNETIEILLSRRDPSKYATAFINPATNRPEPLLTIWEPRAKSILLEHIDNNVTGPSYILNSVDCCKFQAPGIEIFESINTMEQLASIQIEH